MWFSYPWREISIFFFLVVLSFLGVRSAREQKRAKDEHSEEEAEDQPSLPF